MRRIVLLRSFVAYQFYIYFHFHEPFSDICTTYDGLVSAILSRRAMQAGIFYALATAGNDERKSGNSIV